jgi:putative AdoMet-dependent methyltransferase
MLDKDGFDLWSNNYDETVDISDKENSYPFAGYTKLMTIIFKKIQKAQHGNILDIGIGTGILCSKLYEMGYKITGIDFSEEMIKKCKLRMPLATLIKHDFSKGLPKTIENNKYNFIISTYALHHLNDDEKVALLKTLFGNLEKNGIIIIGDICFETRDEMDKCRKKDLDEWDDEHYFIIDEFKNKIGKEFRMNYEKISFCSGIISIM